MKAVNSYIFFSVLFCALFLTGCPNSKTKVTKISTPSSGKSRKLNGVFYALPQNVVTVAVPVVKTLKTPGKYVVFTPFFFPDEDFIGGKSVKFEIKDPVFNSFGEPDPAEIYLVDAQSNNLLQTKSLSIDLSTAGVLGNAKAETKDDTLPVATSLIKSAVGITSSVLLRGPIGPLASVKPAGNASENAFASEFKTFSMKSSKKMPDCGTKEMKEKYNFSKLTYLGVRTANEENTDAQFLCRLTDKKEGIAYIFLTFQERAYYRYLYDNSFDAEALRLFRESQAARDFFAAAAAALSLDNPSELTEDDFLFIKNLDPTPTKEWYCNLNTIKKKYAPAGAVAECDPEASATPLLSAYEAYLWILTRPAARTDFYQALLIVDEIDNRIAERNRFINGIVGSSLPAETFNKALEELNKAIGALKQPNFIGSTAKDQDLLGPFEITPDKSGGGSLAKDLFYLSATKGVCGIAPNNDGIKPGKFSTDKCLKTGGAIIIDKDQGLAFLNIKLGKDGADGNQFSKVVAAASLEEKGSRGFAYRIPAVCLAILKFRKQVSEKDATDAEVLALKESEMGRSPFDIAQLGRTVTLPASTKSWRTKYEIALYQNTGALKNFQLGTENDIQKSLDNLTAAAQTAIDSTDTVKRLEREKKILELQKAIRCLETGEGCD